MNRLISAFCVTGMLAPLASIPLNAAPLANPTSSSPSAQFQLISNHWNGPRDGGGGRDWDQGKDGRDWDQKGGREWEGDKRRDCHRRPERHYLRDYGRRVLHRHVGPRCRVDVLRPRRDFDRRDHDRLECLWVGGVQVCFKD
jgi:hypothetical protein